uniref:Acetyl-CoA carboxylase beta subunit n=1 Tax=Panagrolaimus sp. ES5 TaxID=591445 RepID=A0AC34FNJ9_9BILA
MFSSVDSRIPSIYHETKSRTRLPSITPSTFSIDESLVEYIDSCSSAEEFSSQLNSEKNSREWNFNEDKKIKKNDSGEKYNDDKKHQGKLFKGFKNMLNKFMYVDVPTTDINESGTGSIDERSVCITWLVGL